MGKAANTTEANGNGNANSGKMFSAECVSVLLMAMGTVSISKTQYEMMSALDGNHTASSYQHQFRSVLQKAKELKKRVDEGEEFVPVQPGAKKRGAGATNVTPPPTPKKPKSQEPADEDDTPPPRKPKATRKPKPGGAHKGKAATKPVPQADGDNIEETFHDADNFIKEEQAWEHEFI